MPIRTDISSILIIGAASLTPFRGRGKSRAAAKGAGGVGIASRVHPTPPSPNPLPLKGERALEVSSQRHQDGARDAFRIGHRVVVCEADYAPALRFEFGGSAGVISFAAGMGFSVQLYDEAMRARHEIGDERRADVLADELDALKAAGAEDFSERAFGVAHVGAELLRSGSGFDVALHFANSPLSPTPLPLKGARGFLAS
ncbi:hypothetical protein [Sphingomonas sp.]|jgi:hypothetical protein|uniref:hypothetical protein n=1 Tax=Sphingomonas sp. TaxID=28214 RepID=UPI003BEECFD1